MSRQGHQQSAWIDRKWGTSIMRLTFSFGVSVLVYTFAKNKKNKERDKEVKLVRRNLKVMFFYEQMIKYTSMGMDIKWK